MILGFFNLSISMLDFLWMFQIKQMLFCARYIFAFLTRQTDLLTMRLWGNQETFILFGLTQHVFTRMERI